MLKRTWLHIYTHIYTHVCSGEPEHTYTRTHKRTHIYSHACSVDPWRRKWQPPPVFLPGESHGRRSLVGYSRWGRKESDPTERLYSLMLSGTWIYIYTHIHSHMLIRTWIYLYIDTYTQTYIHTYAHTHTHICITEAVLYTQSLHDTANQLYFSKDVFKTVLCWI